MQRRAFLATAGAATTVLAGCLGSADPSADEDPDYDVGMGSADFRPERVEVAVGETVVWRNTGNRAHTVTAYDDGLPEGADFFASGGYESESAAREGWQSEFGGAIRGSETYERAFEVPGTYTYFCVPHEPGGMVGEVVVTE